MFEGKNGPRIFKKKEDAETVREVNSPNSSELIVENVRVTDPQLAQEKGISIHHDISIAARGPEEEETGWIVVRKGEGIPERSRKALKLLKD